MSLSPLTPVAEGFDNPPGSASFAPALGGLAAHGAYVRAINSNDVETLMADYFGADAAKWEKTSIGFTVSGDWAFERYTYKSADTDRKTGAVTRDVGKGINVCQHDADGHWRVAIDGWSTDLAAKWRPVFFLSRTAAKVPPTPRSVRRSSTASPQPAGFPWPAGIPSGSGRGSPRAGWPGRRPGWAATGCGWTA